MGNGNPENEQGKTHERGKTADSVPSGQGASSLVSRNSGLDPGLSLGSMSRQLRQELSETTSKFLESDGGSAHDRGIASTGAASRVTFSQPVKHRSDGLSSPDEDRNVPSSAASSKNYVPKRSILDVSISEQDNHSNISEGGRHRRGTSPMIDNRKASTSPFRSSPLGRLGRPANVSSLLLDDSRTGNVNESGQPSPRRRYSAEKLEKMDQRNASPPPAWEAKPFQAYPRGQHWRSTARRAKRASLTATSSRVQRARKATAS